MRILIVLLLALLPLPAFSDDAFILTRQEAEAMLVKELAAQGAGNTLKVSIPGGQDPKLHAADRAFDTEITGLAYDERSQRFTATLRFLDDAGQVIGTRPVSGRYAELESVPVLTRRIGSGEVISASDITWMEVEQSRLRDDAVTAENQLVGQAARRTITPDRPIRLSEIERPAAVKRNQVVTLLFRRPGIEIRAEGKASQDGGIGDTITVTNTDSGVEVRGKVISAQAVDVTPLAPKAIQVGTNTASMAAPLENNASTEAGSE